MKVKKAYSFDDVLLVPKFSTLNSRAEADLSTTIAGVELKIPIIAANMSSVCGAQMAETLGKLGGLGIVHRMCSVEEQAAMVKTAKGDGSYPVGFSIGVGDDWRDRMDACKEHASIVCVDVAHGNHKRVINLLSEYFGSYGGFPIIIGQIANYRAAANIIACVPTEHMATVALKTSIGGGSLCTTRIQTGFGVPTLQAVDDIRSSLTYEVAIIADGGIKNSGDIVKSLAAGANAVMLGGLLAGTDEAPGTIIEGKGGSLFKAYRGSASYSDKILRGERARNIEGEDVLVPCRGPVEGVVNGLLDGVRSGFSYGGAHNITELQKKAEWIEVSAAGHRESLPHGKL